MHLRPHGVRMPEHVDRRVTDQFLAAGSRGAITLTVALPRIPRAVKPVAVELDDQPEPRPAAIDVALVLVPVRFRQQAPIAAKQSHERGLEPAQEQGVVADEDSHQPTTSLDGAALGEQARRDLRSEPIADEGLVAHPTELLVIDAVRDIEQSPGGDHHGNALGQPEPQPHVASAVHDQAGHPAIAWRSDLDHFGLVALQTKKVCARETTDPLPAPHAFVAAM